MPDGAGAAPPREERNFPTRTDRRAGVQECLAEWDLSAVVDASDGREENGGSVKCLEPHSRP